MIIAEPQPAVPKPKLRWYQYRLGTLLVLALMASLGMSWVAVKRQKARWQKAAVEAILRDGGSVIRDYEIDTSGKLVPAAIPARPRGGADVLGDDFDNVFEAEVASDAALKHTNSPRLAVAWIERRRPGDGRRNGSLAGAAETPQAMVRLAH